MKVSRLLIGGLAALAIGAGSFAPPGRAASTPCAAAVCPPLGGGSPSGPAPTASVRPKRSRPPARAALSLALQGVFPVGRGDLVTIPRRPVRANGALRPYVPGERVTVTIRFAGRTLLRRKVVPARSPGGTFGRFSVRFAAPRTGGVAVSAVHLADAAVRRVSAGARFAAISPHASPGARGRFVELIQSRLAALRLYLPQTGVYDLGTALALSAYHRILGWGPGDTLTPATVASLLAGVGAYRVRDPRAGKHAEGDLRRQVVVLAYGPRVFRIFPTSSGAPSTPTVTGHYAVYEKEPGYNGKLMYFSNFFTGGYAIHGYDPAPYYPASHGCMRVPIGDAIPIYNWLDLGNVVDVYP